MNNNPIKLTDPSGHKCVGDEDGCIPGEGGTGPTKPIPPPPPPGNYHDDDDSDPNPNCVGCHIPGEVTIGPIVNPIVTQSDNIFEILNIYFFALHDLLYDPLIQASNIGVPIYKQAKGFIPYGALGESVLGGIFQLLSDLDQPNLSLGQRFGRATVVGFENGITDIASSAVGTGAGLATGLLLIGDFVPLDEVPGGSVVFFVSMVATNAKMTEYFDKHNDSLFYGLGLSGP